MIEEKPQETENQMINHEVESPDEEPKVESAGQEILDFENSHHENSIVNHHEVIIEDNNKV